MTYQGWQMDSTVSLSENVRLAIENYIKTHGEPPNILESQQELPCPNGMVVRWISLPKNIILVGKL